MFEEFGIYGQLIYIFVISVAYIAAAVGIVSLVWVILVVFGVTLENHWDDLKAWWS
jgi:hypothetical protein